MYATHSGIRRKRSDEHIARRLARQMLCFCYSFTQSRVMGVCVHRCMCEHEIGIQFSVPRCDVAHSGSLTIITYSRDDSNFRHQDVSMHMPNNNGKINVTNETQLKRINFVVSLCFSFVIRHNVQLKRPTNVCVRLDFAIHRLHDHDSVFLLLLAVHCKNHNTHCPQRTRDTSAL